VGRPVLAKERDQAVKKSYHRSNLATIRYTRAGGAIETPEDLELTVDEEKFGHPQPG